MRCDILEDYADMFDPLSMMGLSDFDGVWSMIVSS
jgi:hypothetical protein